MANLSAAFAGASHGLDQLAGHAAQQEMMQAEMMRAENLAALRNYYTTNRDLIVTQARGNVLKDVSASRTAQEHAARDEEIDRQEGARARNQTAAQHQQLINTEHAQDNALVNQGELQGRTARVQASRDAMLQANQARQQKAAIRTWLTKYQQQTHGTTGLAGEYDPLNSQQLAQRAQHDSVLASQLQAYKDADTREQQATRAIGTNFQSPYVTMPTGSSVSSSASGALIPYDNEEGPGVSDSPYPAPSASDEVGLSGAGSGGDNDDAGADDGSGS